MILVCALKGMMTRLLERKLRSEFATCARNIVFSLTDFLGSNILFQAHIVSMMRRVSRLFARALDRSLCILVLSGDPGQDRNGLCCAGIKTLQVTLTDGSNSETFSDPD